MDKLQDEMMSLLTHCKKCKTSCCHGKHFIAAPGERDAVVAAGYADHFKELDLGEGEVYHLLDYRGTECGYLAADGSCSIQEIKPLVCQFYPVIFDAKRNLTAAPECPAGSAISVAYVENAWPLLYKYSKAFDGIDQRQILMKYEQQRKMALKNDGC